MNELHIARVVHEAVRAYCTAIGDPAGPSWDDAEKWAIDGTLDAVRRHTKDPSASAPMSHDRWTEERVRAGWIYGPTKDTESKTHPCLVPYDELPLEQRLKDYLVIGVVRALAHDCKE